MHLVVADAVGLGEYVDQSLGHAVHVVGAAEVLEHDHEFVAADACRRRPGRGGPAQGVAEADDGVEPARHHTQQRVADRGAERDVDTMEPIAVDEQDREFIVPDRAAQHRSACSIRSSTTARLGIEVEAVGAAHVAQMGCEPLLFEMHRQR